MVSTLVSLLIALPVVMALLVLVLRGSRMRAGIVVVTGIALSVAALGLLRHGNLAYTPPPLAGVEFEGWVKIADFALLALIFAFGVRLRSWLVGGFALAQALPLAWFEARMVEVREPVAAFRADNLSIVMVLVVSIIGSLVVAFALPYMAEHERHDKLERSRQPRFFFYMLTFLGAMNGLVLANDLALLYFFFEVTTFCSFMLIAHDGTEAARKSALRALWMNCLGGVAFVAGLILWYRTAHSLDLMRVVATPASAAMLLPLMLVCFAGFTKAAQVPFQSWLLGAMIAPTPVSALLHSSTMVKAGVYLALRLAPAYAGTHLGQTVALAGAFSFFVCAALAVGQRNAKKVLAYSTISYLGLILACAGIGAPRALTAAAFLIVFHAVSKGLLFLCVGTIEQHIGSRDIEAMRGLIARMPHTTLITVVGILTMMLPPFGVLLSKWIAIEAASSQPIVVALLALGSALGVVTYARWAGLLLSAPFMQERTADEQPILTRFVLGALALSAVLLPLGLPEAYEHLIAPMYRSVRAPLALGAHGSRGILDVYPLYGVLALLLGLAMIAARRSSRTKLAPPYMSGVPADAAGRAFVGPMSEPVTVEAGSYYLAELFGEDRLTRWINLLAIAGIVLMLVGVLT